MCKRNVWKQKRFGKAKYKGDLRMKFTQFIKNLHREESGQDLLEYALVLAAVLAAVVAGSASLAADISAALVTINGKITAAIG
jgi:Flp pilus assembly pilin Flp